MSTIRLTHNLHLPTIRVQPKRVNKTQDQSEQIGQFWKFLATKAKVAQIFWALKLFKKTLFLVNSFGATLRKKLGYFLFQDLITLPKMYQVEGIMVSKYFLNPKT